jgi:hypothetical protein
MLKTLPPARLTGTTDREARTGLGEEMRVPAMLRAKRVEERQLHAHSERQERSHARVAKPHKANKAKSAPRLPGQNVSSLHVPQKQKALFQKTQRHFQASKHCLEDIY